MKHPVRTLLLGALLGGVLIFLVNSLGWNVLPFTNRAIFDVDDPRVLETVAAATRTAPGTYFVNPNDRRDGLGPGPTYGWLTLFPREHYSVPAMLAASVAHNLVVALLITWVMLGISGALRRRFAAAWVMAALALLLGPVWDWLWAFYSPAFAAAVGLNTLLAHGVAGSAIAVLVDKRESKRAALSAR